MRRFYNGGMRKDDGFTRFDLPEEVRNALGMLTRAGFQAWLVGGCVRDHCLGRAPGDYDIATDARPREAQAAFKGYRTLETGLAHGTITLLTAGRQLEVTTFRKDGAYSDHRRPDSVHFVDDLVQDLTRRDFTCNAMAYHPAHGLRDPFNGQADCEQGILRAVGEPQKRFEEDALRILRGLRFACQLGFAIEENTLSAMMDKGGLLSAVSVERIAGELNRALVSARAGEALRSYPRVLFLALPELEPMLHTPQRTPFHLYDVWEHTLRTLDAAPRDLAIRWAALYHDSGKPHTARTGPDGTTHFRGHQAVSTRLAEQAMDRLKQSRALRERVVALVRYHDERVGPDNLRMYLSRLGPDTALKLLQLQYADLVTHSPLGARRAPLLEELYEEGRRIVAAGEALQVRDLRVDGRDLIALGYRQDARLGRALERLLSLVLRGELPNDREALLDRAGQMLNKHGAQE
jgi:tRNA nucleotidyltransferase (CCA-adding enzyme)